MLCLHEQKRQLMARIGFLCIMCINSWNYRKVMQISISCYLVVVVSCCRLLVVIGAYSRSAFCHGRQHFVRNHSFTCRPRLLTCLLGFFDTLHYQFKQNINHQNQISTRYNNWLSFQINLRYTTCSHILTEHRHIILYLRYE
jgi:hypothetical protein